MRNETAFVAVLICVGLDGYAAGQDGTRFVERTPQPRRPLAHTMERAGNPETVSSHARPSVSPHDAGGYVGGSTLRGNGPIIRGPGVATGPLTTDTFGTDYGGVKMHTARVFLAAFPEPAAGPGISRGYRTDGPHLLSNPFSLRPIRRAVLHSREGREEH
jgi:hypothetical protein